MVEESSTITRKTTLTEMYLMNLTPVIERRSSLDDVLEATDGLWSGIYNRMDSTDTFWVYAPNEYQDGRYWPVSMAVADHAREESDLVLKNTITVHQWTDRGGDMESAYDEILFFVSDKREYVFNKDEIRVEHVYKGNEWGGDREEGKSSYHDTKVRRYNPDGKDPGNVWLDEDRTQTNNQEVDAVHSLPLSEAYRRLVLVGSSPGETVFTVWTDDTVTETLTEIDREHVTVKPDELRREVMQ